ncbi:MAG: translation elongation factor 4 [Clostridiales bacterium]|nr:translation elongation factor 4 [Candidatus Apopatousia equi]
MADDRQTRIRNFCIIAHIDHGKSTLADRLLEETGTVAKRDMESQLLDSMELERERGITIKLTPTRMNYTYDGKDYELNLIDTPGHVDFTYEVSRSLAACEGAILIVDASQGVEAQTLANLYLAIENNLEIIPVINKIDLPSADIENTKKEIRDIIGLDPERAPQISAKEGINIKDVLDRIVTDFPSPNGKEEEPLKALIFDSYYDNYKGAICMVRIVDGHVKAGDKIKMWTTGKEYDVVEVGKFIPETKECDELHAGEVGYIAASIKQVSDTKVGDTITNSLMPCKEALPGYKDAVRVVYCGIFLTDGSKYQELKDALEKLKLNDAALSYTPENSIALGFGFRCGFLGLLHMEIITERLEREFNLDIITTAPSVSYHIYKLNGEMIEISNPVNMPPLTEIDHMEEPWVKLEIYTPPEYVGSLIDLCIEKRGIQKNLKYVDEKRVNLTFDMPLNEIIYDFFDSMKSRSKGYASLDYEISEYRPSDLVKMDILLNGESCDALSLIVHKDKAYHRGKAITEKLKDVIPRQMFEIPIQAAIGSKIIARETIKALRKDVLAKCYGGDITRKKKLLEKQKAGKKRMRQVGSVSIPSEAFMSILKI